ncbi:MAG TPA: hypothetical protein VLI69_04825 [Gammaproteobacteria bacterium]|nr:hypothetical protein [Gammaproteobacteria bacterium]
MAQPRTPDLSAVKPVDTSKLKSTTARLLVGFMEGYLEIPSMPLNPATARSTIVYTELGQLSEKLFSMSDDVSIRAVTTEILDKLKAATAPAAKASYEALNREAEPALKHHEELDENEKTFKKTLEEDREKTFAALKNLLIAVASSKTPEEEAHSQEILSQLESAEKTSKNLTTAFEKIMKARSNSNMQLRVISQRAYDALPSKVGVLPPPAPTPGTLRSNL